MDIIYPGGGSNKKPRLSFDEIKIQIALGTIPSEYIRAQVHDPEILDKLANLSDDEIRYAVAIHPRVRLDTLIRLINDPNSSQRLLIAIVASPKIPIKELYKLAGHKNLMVSEEAIGILFIRSKGSIDIQDD